MKDRKGIEIGVGDRVFVLPSTRDGRDGGSGWVRKINGAKARVDNGRQDMPDMTDPSADWTWSAWVTPAEVEKV